MAYRDTATVRDGHMEHGETSEDAVIDRELRYTSILGNEGITRDDRVSIYRLDVRRGCNTIGISGKLASTAYAEPVRQ